MKFAAILLVAASLASAGAASAATSAIKTDMDYLKASRCRGLATGSGVDTANLDAVLKEESRVRPQVILDRGHDEMDRAKREAADANRKDRVAAELNGACTAYLNVSNSDVARR